MSLQIINQPACVLNHLAPESGLFDAQFKSDRLTRFKALASPAARTLCHPVDVNFMEIMPDLMREAGPGLLKHSAVRDRLAKRPLLAAQMLLSSYDETHAILERIVLGSGEATVPLLLAIDEGLLTSSRSRPQIEATLLKQPLWALQYLKTPAQSPEVRRNRASFVTDLRDQCASRKKQDPQATLVHLALNQDLDPSEATELLCLDPMVAYFASHLFAARGFSVGVSRVQNLDARWATHIALWGAFTGGNVDDRIEAAICTHSAWTGEYIALNESRQKDWNWVKRLYAATGNHAQTRSTNEPDCWDDLLWAMLDRICLQLEGKPARITMAQSYLRHGKGQKS